MELTVIYEDKFQVTVVGSEEDSHALQFLYNVEQSYKASADGLFLLLERISQSGFENITEKQTHLVDRDEKIYEFIKGSLRLFYFKGQGNTLIVCTSALIKQGKKVDPAAVATAVACKNAYYAALENRTLILN